VIEDEHLYFGLCLLLFRPAFKDRDERPDGVQQVLNGPFNPLSFGLGHVVFTGQEFPERESEAPAAVPFQTTDFV
jgi:hypothetical protein